jgi:hypothetical protein
MHAQRCNLLARTALAVIVLALAVPAGAAGATGVPEPSPAPVGGVVEQGAVMPPQEAVAAPSEPVVAPSEPVVAPSQPIAAPSEPVPVPSEPVAAPSEPAAAPNEPLPAPSNPVALPRDPRAAPRAPVAAPRERMAAPSESVADPTQPVADPSNDAVPALAPGATPAAPADVAPKAPIPPRHDRSGRRGLRTHVRVLLRHVNEGIRNVNRQLAAGRVPSESSLRDLRKNVEELVPAVDALERHRAAGPSVPGGRARLERGLRRAVAGAVVLVVALVRSGADTAESERLLGLLRRLAGISPSAGSPDRPGAAYAAPGAAAQPVAYTQPATYSHSSRTSSPSDARTSVTIADPELAADLPPDPLNPARIARLATSAPGGSSSGWLAAAALLLTVAASGSFASIAMSRWGGSPAPRRTRGLTRRS